MYEITKDKYVYAMDKNNTPPLTVPSGSTVTFHTNDCFGGQITSNETNLAKLDWNHINPATGPLAIAGAEVGDTLKIEILTIKIAHQVALITGKDIGVCANQFDKIENCVMPVKDGFVEFSDKIKIPIRPMIGVIGVAPAGMAINNGTPGEHGGNMDCKEIVEGVTLYLPVYVTGALLAIGDLHAVMADGEVCGCGGEVAGSVVVRVEVVKDNPYPTPFIENEDFYIPISSSQTADEAIDTVVKKGVDFLMNQYHFSRMEAISFISLAADVRICQVVDPLKTARLEIPKKLIQV